MLLKAGQTVELLKTLWTPYTFHFETHSKEVVNCVLPLKLETVEKNKLRFFFLVEFTLGNIRVAVMLLAHFRKINVARVVFYSTRYLQNTAICLNAPSVLF